jgi:hypothetical protein
MKISIIGAGQIGGTLAHRLTALGHEVSIANSRGPETLADLAAAIGATAVSVTEAARRRGGRHCVDPGEEHPGPARRSFR